MQGALRLRNSEKLGARLGLSSILPMALGLLLLVILTAPYVRAEQASDTTPALNSPVWSGVLLTASGRPVAGAILAAVGPQPRIERHTAVTGADGHFTFVGLPAGSYAISARVP